MEEQYTCCCKKAETWRDDEGRVSKGSQDYAHIASTQVSGPIIGCFHQRGTDPYSYRTHVKRMSPKIFTRGRRFSQFRQYSWNGSAGRRNNRKHSFWSFHLIFIPKIFQSGNSLKWCNVLWIKTYVTLSPVPLLLFQFSYKWLKYS